MSEHLPTQYQNFIQRWQKKTPSKRAWKNLVDKNSQRGLRRHRRVGRGKTVVLGLAIFRVEAYSRARTTNSRIQDRQWFNSQH